MTSTFTISGQTAGRTPAFFSDRSQRIQTQAAGSTSPGAKRHLHLPSEETALLEWLLRQLLSVFFLKHTLS